MLGIQGHTFNWMSFFWKIKKSFFFRDEAVESKNAAEVELAKNRIEMMQVRSIMDS